jgi:uncharacterized protein DUF6448
MSDRYNVKRIVLIVAGLTWAAVSAAPPADAHCDTMDGPVVAAARAALAKGDVTPVLMWIKEDGEGETRAAFAKALVVRTKGPEARDLADMYFFETLVRLHRRGEGEPYTGLKPAGADPGPAVAGADKALESGSVDSLVSQVTESSSAGIRERFRHAMETRTHSGESVEAGRKYVEAYVEFLHYTERLFESAVSDASKDVTR